jgi:hypothetical protein
MSRPKKAKRGPTAAERVAAQARGVSLEAPVSPLVRVTRYLAVAGDQPLVVVQAAHRAVAEAVVARMRAPAHVAGHPACVVMPVSKASAVLRSAMAAALCYAWHPAACPACLRVWRSPAWALDTCPTCLGLTGVEGFCGGEDADEGARRAP